MLGVHHSRPGRPHYLVATKNKPYTDLNTSRAPFFKISSYNTLYHIGSGCGCLYVFTVQYGHPGRPHCTIDITNTPYTTQSICRVPFCKISMYKFLQCIGGGCDCLYVLGGQYGRPGRPYCTIDISNTPYTTTSICRVPFCKISIYNTLQCIDGGCDYLDVLGVQYGRPGRPHCTIDIINTPYTTQSICRVPFCKISMYKFLHCIGGGCDCLYVLGGQYGRPGRPYCIVDTSNRPYTTQSIARLSFWKISIYNTLQCIDDGCDYLDVLGVQYGHPGRPHRTIDIINTPYTTQSICRVLFFKISIYHTYLLYWWWLWLCICVGCVVWSSRTATLHHGHH